MNFLARRKLKNGRRWHRSGILISVIITVVPGDGPLTIENAGSVEKRKSAGRRRRKATGPG